VYVREARAQVVKADAFLKPAAPGDPYPWITAATQRRQTGSSELLEVGQQPAPARVAAAFGLASGDPVIMRKQLLLLDGEPAELVRNYYPLAIARGTPLERPKKIRGGSPVVFAGLGLLPARAVDHVLPRLATVEEFIALRLPEDVPVLRQFRVVYTAAGQPIEATVMIKAGQRYEVEYELKEQ
jgi:GntR family transcriptional regulator